MRGQKKRTVILDGKPVGRIKAGWLLFKETWRYLRVDPEMIWIPLISTFINVMIFSVLFAISYIVLGVYLIPEESTESFSVINYVLIFIAYLCFAFTLSVAQAAITNTVYTRAQGKDATLNDSLKAAFSRWWALFLWSVIAATVGLLLFIMNKRAQKGNNIIAKLIVRVFDLGWSVLTYFVVPAIMVEKISAFKAIKKSGSVFRATWGETFVSNISIGVIFMMMYVLLAVALCPLGFILSNLMGPVAILVLVVLYLLTVFILGLVQSAMNGVLKTLLYLYATGGVAPANFNQELLEKMLYRQKPPAPAAPTPPTPPDSNTTITTPTSVTPTPPTSPTTPPAAPPAEPNPTRWR